MKLPLNEPVAAKYLYISEDNIVYVLMPVVSGTVIGLDNTCKAVYSLQEFFGKGSNSNKKSTLKDELLSYQEALDNDLSLLGESDALLAQQKQERLTQLNAYLQVIKNLDNHPELSCLNQGFPSYPRPLEALMQDRASSNLYSMVLRPSEEDGYLRSEAANPIFSVAHRSVAKGIQHVVSPLQQALIQSYGPLSYEAKDLKTQVIQQVLAQLELVMPVDFKQLRQTLQQTVYALLNISIDFTKTQQGTDLHQINIDEGMGFNPETTTAKEYMDALLGYCAPELFDTTLESPFNTLITAESWSIATQFLLGIANFYGVAQGKINPDTNFGKILDSNPALSNSLAQTLANAQQSNHSIEDACLFWMNEHASALKLISALTRADREAIKHIFAERYAEIKDSLHFDEFFLLDTQTKGDFFIHQGSICTHFAKFASSPLFDLPPQLTQPLEKACHTASRLSTEIPHTNPLFQGDVEINTKTLDTVALQALYEHINTYKDPKIKKQLFAQLKQERPDFKPQVDAKQFLQHVAYGQQNEAEELLKKDPQLAQELLRANTIRFTDYSGRTFSCTAYEYAYWAKDAHMLKMLEKYIKQDEETRLFILERVDAIEKPVNPNPAAGFFESPKPQGLHYSTQSKEGQTIDHWEAHFDLTPLKTALTTYINAYDESPKQSQADIDALDAIWIQVGLPQREIPAHIAQEYCHPRQSFDDISKNTALLHASNSANLERSLAFFNGVTESHDVWFTTESYSVDSGLGSSFAIFRANAEVRAVGRAWGPGIMMARIDLSAIKAIDTARTDDLMQSRAFLSRPVIVQDPPPLVI